MEIETEIVTNAQLVLTEGSIGITRYSSFQDLYELAKIDRQYCLLYRYEIEEKKKRIKRIYWKWKRLARENLMQRTRILWKYHIAQHIENRALGSYPLGGVYKILGGGYKGEIVSGFSKRLIDIYVIGIGTLTTVTSMHWSGTLNFCADFRFVFRFVLLHCWDSQEIHAMLPLELQTNDSTYANNAIVCRQCMLNKKVPLGGIGFLLKK